MIRADGGCIRTIAADATRKDIRELSRKTNNKGETSMTALILQAAPFVELAAPKLRAIYRRFLDAVDAFAMYRMQRAVPEWELRRAEREINRYRRLMHESNARQVRAKSAQASSHHNARSMQMR
jgi:cob(I)alamin adenosyltransferase